MSSKSVAVILAAGMGKRMKSDLPKVLHKVQDKYLVDYVIDNARQAGVDRIILVIGHKHELVRKSLAGRDVEFVLQEPQRGTGHAVQQVVPKLAGYDGNIFVLCGDMPFVSPDTLRQTMTLRDDLDAAAVVLTVDLEEPGKFGRIVRGRDGLLESIVEYKDADEETRALKEVNTGAYCFDYKSLLTVLNKLNSENAQSEYYLTDTIALFKNDQRIVAALKSDNPIEGMGVNSPDELAEMEAIMAEQ